MSVPFDPTKTEYEMFIDISYNHVINQNKIHCVTKDKLLEGLTAINNIENANLYNYYIIGKLNSSCPFPTWDIDTILTSDTVDEAQLLDAMKNIKDPNVVYDLLRYCLKDKDGKKMFDESTISFIQKKSSHVLNRIFTEAINLNYLDDSSLDELKKK